MKILHLSDLHLGAPFLLALAFLRSWKSKPGISITEGLKTAIRNLRPDYIVISGDFVNKAQLPCFRFAAEYLRDLLLDVGFDLSRKVLVVPGNHDVSFFPRRHMDAAARLEGYRQFCRYLFNKVADIHVPPEVIVDNANKVVFICMDSTLKSELPLAEGEIGQEQIRWIEEKLEEMIGANAEAREYVKIAIMHHHLIPLSEGTAKDERLMQLLDAGQVMQAFQRIGINIVLHGHRHVPQVKLQLRPDLSVFTVVSAGTALSPYLSEQKSWGNNFNLIEVSPKINELTVQIYKADSSGNFIPCGENKRMPLFRIDLLGYVIRKIRKVVEISSDGTKTNRISKEGIRVTQEGSALEQLPFLIVAEARVARIVKFDLDESTVSMHPYVQMPRVLKGGFQLRQPLKLGGGELDVSYTYALKNGVAMSQMDLGQYYNDGRRTEETAFYVQNAVNVLEIEVQFPPHYPVQPEVMADYLGGQLSLSHSFKNLGLGRWLLEVKEPPVGTRVRIVWNVPAKWTKATVEVLPSSLLRKARKKGA